MGARDWWRAQGEREVSSPWRPGGVVRPSPEPDDRSPRPLSADQIASFEAAADERTRKRRRKKVRQTDPAVTLLRELAVTHPLRVRRIRRDLAWLQRQGRKRGLDPFEDL